jgi:hypothetical protein
MRLNATSTLAHLDSPMTTNARLTLLTWLLGIAFALEVAILAKVW